MYSYASGYMQGLAADVAVSPSQLWELAGYPLVSSKSAPPPPYQSTVEEDLQKLADLSQWTDGEADYPGRLRTSLLGEIDAMATEAATAAASAAESEQTTLMVGPIPICPFPNVMHSASLTAIPAVAGIGYVMTMPPNFNWSAFISLDDTKASSKYLIHELMPTGDDEIPDTVAIEVKKGTSTVGNNELEIWQWYARTMSYDMKAGMTFPYISYDVDIVRTTFYNGSKPRVEAGAKVSSGMMSHEDAANYYGYGAGSDVLPLASCGDVYSIMESDMGELFSIAQELGFTGDLDAFLFDETNALSDLLPSENLASPLTCGDPATGVHGWPAPACTAAQVLRARSPFPSSPLTFNVTSQAMLDRLATAHSSIQNTTWSVVHQGMLSGIISNPSVRDTSFGWQTVRANALSISGLQQLQHGCGFYCIDPIKQGVGDAQTVYASLPSVQYENIVSRGLGTTRVLQAYVQRRRPRLVCDNTSFSLPWVRNDDSEFYSGDLSAILQTSSLKGWQSARVPAPVALILFRTNSWTDVAISATKQSVLTLIGSTMGIAGPMVLVLLLSKRYLYLSRKHINRQLSKSGGEFKTLNKLRSRTINVAGKAASGSATPLDNSSPVDTNGNSAYNISSSHSPTPDARGVSLV
jgi:hypothetical protein